MAQQASNSIPLQKPPAPPAPVLNPQLGKDLAAWMAEMEQISIDEQQIKKLAAMLGTMKNTAFGVQEVMGAFMNLQGAQIGGLSAVDNVDTDLRNEIGDGQSSINGMQNGDKTAVDEAKKLVQVLDGILAFLKYEGAQGKHSIFGSGSVKGLKDAIDTIKAQFVVSGPNGTKTSVWGDPAKMADEMQGWVNEGKKLGTYAPQLKSIQDALGTLNQSTSALSTTTNTQLQYKAQEFKQMMGERESSMQAYLKALSTMVNNQKSN